MDFGGGEEIRFERAGKAGLVTLSRPQALNALTQDMIRALSAALDAWEADPAVALVVVRAEGRGFCAGGDLMEVHRARATPERLVGFFADEYRLNARIGRFRKPYVTLIDGVVMGGGVGISIHGSHRVMTENALFAMPEVGIGFFPDVGGSHVLGDLGGCFGMYLGLTGARIGHGDALWSGLATHTMQATYLPGLIDRLCETGEADLALREVFQAARRAFDGAALQSVARHFCLASVEAILASLRATAGSDAFAARTLAELGRKSPTSLKVAHRAIRAGQTMSLDDCLRMEFRIVNRMLEGHDFYEGIRAAIVDKDWAPAWRPATLAEVSDAAIDAYFAPLPGGEVVL